MKVLVYEHVSGGGFSGKLMPTSILCEGFAMLRTIISDFKAAGHSVTTVLDSRLKLLNPPLDADLIAFNSSPQEGQTVLQELSESVDAAFVIAPESNKILQTLVENIEHTGVTSLNSRSNFIRSVSDKTSVIERAKELGLHTPKTILFSAYDTPRKIKKAICSGLNFPLIVKPVDGVGCAGLSVIDNERLLAVAIAKAMSESANNYFMVQELIDGTAVSVSLLSTGNDLLPVSLNWQDVILEPPGGTSTYKGGQVPFDSLLKRDAFAAAEKFVKSFDGLRGYIGVDMILSGMEVVLMEVNPRITTSFIGMRRTLGFNYAQTLIDAIIDNKLPAINQSNGYAVFSKVKTPKPAVTTLLKTYFINQVISPPFPVSGSENAEALVLAHGTTVKEASARFQEAKKSLFSLLRSGGD